MHFVLLCLEYYTSHVGVDPMGRKEGCSLNPSKLFFPYMSKKLFNYFFIDY